MKLGKVYIKEGLTAEHVTALSEFINSNFKILEKIASVAKDGKTFVMMIAICHLFPDQDDSMKEIPTYEFEFFNGLAIADNADEIFCKIKGI